MLIFFDKTEAGYAYKRYAYKKTNMYRYGNNKMHLQTMKRKHIMGIIFDIY